jgi:hypothetical protein
MFFQLPCWKTIIRDLCWASVKFSGRVRYTFASFWSRNRTFRALETALHSYEATLEAEKQVLSHIFLFRLVEMTLYLCLLSHKQVRAHVLLQKESNSVLGSKTDSTKTPGKNIEKSITFQPFINKHVLADVTSVSIPLCLANSSDV